MWRNARRWGRGTSKSDGILALLSGPTPRTKIGIDSRIGLPLPCCVLRCAVGVTRPAGVVGVSERGGRRIIRLSTPNNARVGAPPRHRTAARGLPPAGAGWTAQRAARGTVGRAPAESGVGNPRTRAVGGTAYPGLGGRFRGGEGRPVRQPRGCGGEEHDDEGVVWSEQAFGSAPARSVPQPLTRSRAP